MILWKGVKIYEILLLWLCTQPNRSAKWYHGWLWDCSISCDSFFLLLRHTMIKREPNFVSWSWFQLWPYLALLLVSITTYQNNQVSNNKFQTSLHFIEVVSKDLGVDKSEVYVNTSTNTDGALIKVGDRYYRALNGSEPDKYLLEKVELYKTDAIELVDVNKWHLIISKF